MRRNIKIIILAFLLITGIFIYKSPDEAYWLKPDTQKAIRIGRTYAYYLLSGHKKGLLEMSIEPAKTKIEESNFHEIAISEMTKQIEKKEYIDIEIIAPLLEERNDENMELIRLVKFESFIVMTFAYKSWNNIVEIPGKGKMFFSVGMRYHTPIDHQIETKIVRKIANLPLLRNFTGRMGTTGQWLVFAYSYKYSLNDYFDWVLKEGEYYSKRKNEEFEELQEPGKLKKHIDKILKELAGSQKSLDFLYAWGSIEVERQIENMESLYNISPYR